MLTSAVFSPAKVPVVIGVRRDLPGDGRAAVRTDSTRDLQAAGEVDGAAPLHLDLPGLGARLVMVPVKVTVCPLGTTIVTCPATVRLRVIVVADVTFSVVAGVHGERGRRGAQVGVAGNLQRRAVAGDGGGAGVGVVGGGQPDEASHR